MSAEKTGHTCFGATLSMLNILSRYGTALTQVYNRVRSLDVALVMEVSIVF